MHIKRLFYFLIYIGVVCAMRLKSHYNIKIFFSTPYSLLPTPYSLLPTPYSLLPTPHSPPMQIGMNTPRQLLNIHKG
jgi:hypothetical protein